MYITAVKSFLRFYSDVAVVAHDDGTLTTEDLDTIQRHIEGIRVIRRCDADKTVRDLLGAFPRTTKYRAEITNSLELTDHTLLADREKLIITNSDTLFLRRPDEVIDWISADDGEVLCVYEEQPFQQAEFLGRVQSPFPPHLTLALVCLHKSVVDPTGIEDFLSQVEQADDPWFIGQNTLPALIGKRVDKNRVRFLDQTRYEASGVFREGAIFRHYWTSLASLRPQYFADAKRVINELNSSRP